MAKQVVAVLFGGRSVEHEVSVISGHQAMDALEVAGYDLLPVFIDKEGVWFAGKGLYNLKQYGVPGFRPDALRDVHRVFLAPDPSIRQFVLHPNGAKGFFYKPPMLWADVFFPVIHGAFGEDGSLQGLFEMADVPYAGCGVFASAAGMDKIRQKELYARAGLPALECVFTHRNAWKTDPTAFVREVEAKFGYPVIVKPATLGSSIGIGRAADSRQFTEAMQVALTFDERVLVERALTGFQEVNCSVIGPQYKASVCEMPKLEGELLSFDAKYKSGAGVKGGGAKGAGGAKMMSKGGMASLNRQIPAPISDELTKQVQDYAVRAFSALNGQGIARIDFLRDSDGHVYVNEINTMPGSLSFYLWEASGLPFDKLVRMLVDEAVKRHETKRQTQYSLDVNLLGAR
ncbi:MAG: D-alanine--D-alanine ligase [Acidobacteria bacterium]|nr:D-alanine--D-alanine ligase [Acidobacteriota bacterium]